MENKLTLKLDAEIIEWAKKYAQKQGMSLSKWMEQYFRAKKLQEEVLSDEIDDSEIDPIVKSLSGIVNAEVADNYKNEIADYLIEKYHEK